MPRWQRWTTWIVLALCLASGLAYLAGMDWIDAGPASLKFWWIAHGTTSFVALLAIGGATALHVKAAWRADRGRWSGTANLVALLVLTLSAMTLFYGQPAWRDPARWIHVVVGVIAFALFPAHVLWGRTRRGRAGNARDPGA